MSGPSPAKHIRTMRRRVEFLRSRPYENTWDKAEIAALEWALSLLATPVAHVTKEAAQ